MRFLSKLTKNPNVEFVTLDLNNKISRSMVTRYLESLLQRHDGYDLDDFTITYSFRENPRGEEISRVIVEVSGEDILLDNDFDEGTLAHPFMLNKEVEVGKNLEQCLNYIFDNILSDKNVLYLNIFHSESVMNEPNIMHPSRWDLTILREDDIEYYKQQELESNAWLNKYLNA